MGAQSTKIYENRGSALTFMSTDYRLDPDLEFLAYCEEDDLKVLARYLTHDKDGSERIASVLLTEEEFKKHEGAPDQHRRSWRLIAGELQHFGGDTIANALRRKGVLYREIVGNAAGKLKLKPKTSESAADLELRIVDHCLAAAWKKMSEKERDDLRATVGISAGLSASETLTSLRAVISEGGIGALPMAAIIANALATTILGTGVRLVGARLVAGPAILAAAPVLVALSGVLAIPAITGTAYRVTMPCVLQIAYMRLAREGANRY